ncbi:Phosphopantothenoylcysteine decarboxylase [Chitinispirillum alkaliphilum]|nr:Phosphopantothenoylcysteine decarboxylase [Chitinispirillum alkaliphilum]
MATSPKILIGITGGIAGYKIPQLIRILRKKRCEVKTVLTPNARGFVGEASLRTVSGNPVYTDEVQFYDMNHIRLAEWADIFIVCPATANTIAKISHGVADNLLTSLALSIPEEKIIIAPAMNSVMWASSANQSNIGLLKSRGITVLPVDEGELACGVEGAGRMIPVEDIAHQLLYRKTASSIFNGKRVLLSSGPTEEPIDPVRVITNRSSGQMGAALARVAIDMGAEVVMVSGPAKVQPPSGARIVPVRTAQQMQDALEREFESCDVCIMAAAVSDYRPVSYSDSKLSREAENHRIIELVSNPDILKGLGMRKGGRILVGFSLESDDNIERASEKMIRKKCDMMVFNRADTALEKKSTQINLLFADGRVEKYPAMDKLKAASYILSSIAAISGK